MKISEHYTNSGAGVLPLSQDRNKKQSLVFVIASAAAGTLIEFYDLILAVVLASIISRNLFPEGEARFLETLAIIVTSYFVRPVGALLFGSIGDSKGRKKPFLVSLLLMGSATFLIGCIPIFETIGWLRCYYSSCGCCKGWRSAENIPELPCM